MVLSFFCTAVEVFDSRVSGTSLDAEKGMGRSAPLEVLVEEVLQGVGLPSAL